MYFKTSLGLAMLWCLVLFCISAVELRIYIIHERSNKRSKRTPISKFNMVFWVLLAIMTSAVLVVTNTIIQMMGLVDPSRFTTTTYQGKEGDFDEVTILHGPTAALCIHLAYSVFLLGSLLISISWVELTIKVGTKLGQHASKRWLTRWKAFVVITVALYVVCHIGLLTSGLFIALAYTHPAMTLIVAIVFLVGRNAFLKLLQHRTGAESKSFQLSKMISRSTLSNMILLAGSAIAMLGYASMFLQHRKIVPVGAFNVVLFVRDICLVFGLMLSTINYHYCRKVIRNLSAKNSKVTSQTNVAKFIVS